MLGTAEGHDYLKNQLWWLGMTIMVVGEVANFGAYSYAPAILVTPLGALSVLVSSVSASCFLGEQLGRDGIIGCFLCIIGSIVIILHAPAEQNVQSVSEMMRLALQPGFMFYSLSVMAVTLVLARSLAPRYGKTNPLIYISICSLVGSLTVIACKAFGIAVRLTLAGDNQFVNLSAYVFIAITASCIMIQMNYFNKALDVFSTSVVTPIYYVFFTTFTIIASVIFFQGIYDTEVEDVVTIFCGFFTIFIGVFLLNSQKKHVHRPVRHREDFSLTGKTLLHNFDHGTLGLSLFDEGHDDIN